MEILIYIVVGIFALYLISKISLYLYRPIYLSRMLQNFENKYHRVLSNLEKDLKEAVENLEKWRNDEEDIRLVIATEDELLKRIDELKANKAHEQEMYEKFLRAKERFIQDPKKLSESIIAYKRYLEIYLKREQDSGFYARALRTGSISIDDFVTAANEVKIALEETERKLDKLLVK